MRNSFTVIAFLTILSAACGENHKGGDHGNENEVITTVVLTFSPDGGGAPLVFEFDDPDGDGGDAPMTDVIELFGGSYALTVIFENRLESPPEDITEEVEDEAEEHQLFFTGSAVDGPATINTGAPLAHVYNDQDANGLPIGLTNSIDASAGSGELIVTLRHVPPVNGVAVKSATLAQDVSEGGFASIGGSTDAQVTFSVTVQ
jgi:hypothetical protein